jgi:hypothetical protein
MSKAKGRLILMKNDEVKSTIGRCVCQSAYFMSETAV